MSMAYEDYMRQLVQPMRQELTQNDFEELTTEEAVEQYFEEVSGTTFVVINSVCGCAAGLARPAAVHAVRHAKHTPDHLVTVFAGQDREATGKMRELLGDYEPSSPSMALLKGNEVVHFVPREEIEGQEVEAIFERLVRTFDEHCE
ncbi:BrxA/BrxB family bacilliredoxin [Bacillus fonticola]|uniref:BrxA/BrxB family bacilliredoxin n=1 Tax=Bacillus fonticola TaxID=2728853 RepID=UPI00147496DD|nr:BrxA/BrxB family bacilliredoxin [Bacillus fonticola]